MVKAVIFDLDGTLLDTETICYQVGQEVVERHGKQLTKEVVRLGLGKTPHDCWAAIAEALELPVSAEQLVQESEPALQAQWGRARLLPGAKRLLRHLAAHGIPAAIATSTPRSSFTLKAASHYELRECCQSVVCGDEVEFGKPHPSIFQRAADKLQIPCKDCLAFEDAPSGIQAAQAAGMRVLAVPSLLGAEEYKALGCELSPSLLDFKPHEYGLPAFNDYIHGTVPLVSERWCLKGEVVSGFGRGSKELGIPTANLSTEAVASTLSDAVTGIYYGWASVGDKSAVHMMCMSVGYNPFYNNTLKTCEPWLLADFDNDFYGQELRLLVCGYIRPEADFVSLEDLKASIMQDAETTKQALAHESMAALCRDPCLEPGSAAA